MKGARVFSVPMTLEPAFGWRWRAEDYSQESTEWFVFRRDCILDAERNGFAVFSELAPSAGADARRGAPTGPRDSTHRHEGSENILSRVPGQYISAALSTLPNPATAPQDNMEVSIDVPGFGRVRLTLKRLKHQRGRSMGYVWTALEAIAVDG